MKLHEYNTLTNAGLVAPLAGAWIEIALMENKYKIDTSLPSRERGLKYCVDYILGRKPSVAPLAGAWIEI